MQMSSDTAFRLPYVFNLVSSSKCFALFQGLLDQKKRPLGWTILGNDKIGDRCKTSR